jgi:carbon-monoxide dehydrogenase large subunit
MSTTFARDYLMHGEIAATRDGKILGLRARVLADHGAFNATAQPTRFPVASSTSSPGPTTCRRRTAR